MSPEFGTLYALDASEEGRLYKVRLTEKIFEKIRYSFANDIVVFDASGNLVPFFIRKANETGRSNAAVLKSAQIPVFSLPQKKGGSSTLLDVSIKTGAGGRVIEVRERDARRNTSLEGNRRYLLDLSGPLNEIPDMATALKISSCILSLDLGGTADMMASVNIYGSHNLKDWELLNEREPLVRLNQGERRVESRRIQMGSARRYLLLYMEDEGNAPLRGASIEFFETPVWKPAEDGKSFEGLWGENPRMVLYDTKGVFPAERINLTLTSPGIYPASLYTRRSATDDWERLGRMKLSLIKSSSGERRNVPVDLTSPFERRYWAVSFDATPPAQPPRLEFSWQPKEVVFLAQGPSPYMIAVGRKESGIGMQTPELLDEALKEIPEKDILESKVGEILSVDVAAMQAKESEKTQAKAWQQYLLWGVLIIGALLLSWMAWNLLQKSKEKS